MDGGHRCTMKRRDKNISSRGKVITSENDITDGAAVRFWVGGWEVIKVKNRTGLLHPSLCLVQQGRGWGRGTSV